MHRSARSVIEERMHPKDADELIDALDAAGFVIVEKVDVAEANRRERRRFQPND